MVRRLRPNLIIILGILLGLLITTLLGDSFTLLAVFQTSSSSSYGSGGFGACEYGSGCAEASTGQSGGSGTGGKRYAAPDLELSRKIIKIMLKQGETKSLELKIKNTASSAQSLTIELQDLEKLLMISETSFSLEPYEEKTLALTFTASETESPEVYTGKIIIRSEFTQKILPIVIEVQERKALFDIKVKVPQEFKTIEQGKEAEADIMMYNLGDLMPVDVVLSYSIKDFDGRTYNFGHETLAVEEQKRIRTKIIVPEDLKPDSYLFYALLEYEEQNATSSDIFEVKQKAEEKRGSFRESLKEHKLMFSAGMLILVMLVIIAVYGVKKSRKKANEVGAWKDQQTIQQAKKEEKKEEENKKFVAEFGKFVKEVENDIRKKRMKGLY